jgi:hypothetical protein
MRNLDIKAADLDLEDPESKRGRQLSSLRRQARVSLVFHLVCTLIWLITAVTYIFDVKDNSLDCGGVTAVDIFGIVYGSCMVIEAGFLICFDRMVNVRFASRRKYKSRSGSVHIVLMPLLTILAASGLFTLHFALHSSTCYEAIDESWSVVAKSLQLLLVPQIIWFVINFVLLVRKALSRCYDKPRNGPYLCSDEEQDAIFEQEEATRLHE